MLPVYELCNMHFFLTFEIEVVLFFSGAGKLLCCPWAETAHSDDSCLQTTLMLLTEKVRMTFGVGPYTT